MPIAADKAKPIQNIGLADRTVRFIVGAGVIGAMVFYYGMEHPVLNIASQVGLIILALYPLWTSNVGWDPFYAMFGICSGNDTGRNQCGTLPYQVKAAAGKAPRYCDIDDERSLEACHDYPEGRNLHPVWEVDREPILYPDRETLDEFFRNHPAPSAAEGEAPGRAERGPVDVGAGKGRSSVKAA